MPNHSELLKINSPARRTNKLFTAWNITPANLKSARSEAELGRPLYYYQILDDIKTLDGHLAGELQTRKDAILGLPFTITGEQTAQVDFIKAALKMVDYYTLVEMILDSVYHGFRILDLDEWKMINGKIMPTHIDMFENSLFRSATVDEAKTAMSIKDILMYQYETGKYIPLKEYAENRLIVADFNITSYKQLPVNFTRLGLGAACAFFSIIKHYNVQDWSSFNELMAQPARIGTYNSAASEDEIDELTEAVQGWGTDMAAVISENCKIDLQEAQKSGSISTYDTLITQSNKMQSIIIVGQTGTSDLKDAHSYAAVRVLNGVRFEKMLSDGRFAMQVINEQFIQRLLKLNFAQPDPTVGLEIRFPDWTDLESEIRILREAYEMGCPIPVSHLQKRFKIPAAKDGEEVLRKTEGKLTGLF